MNKNNFLIAFISFYYKLMFSNCFMRKYYRKWGVKQWEPHPCFCLPPCAQRKPHERGIDIGGWGAGGGRKLLEGISKGFGLMEHELQRPRGQHISWKGVSSEKARARK